MPGNKREKRVVLTAAKISKAFWRSDKKELLKVLQGVSLEIFEGERIAIVGPSGEGKTTLLRIFAKLLPPDKGKITLNPSIGKKGKAISAFIFQDIRLLPWRTALENVELGLEFLRINKEVLKKRAFNALVEMGLKEYKDFFPGQLSTGMQKRVGLARAMAVEPVLMFLDEPLSSVDAIRREQLQYFILRALRGKTAIIVTHDIEEAIILGSKVGILSGSPATLKGKNLAPNSFWDTERYTSEARYNKEFIDIKNKIIEQLKKSKES